MGLTLSILRGANRILSAGHEPNDLCWRCLIRRIPQVSCGFSRSGVLTINNSGSPPS